MSNNVNFPTDTYCPPEYIGLQAFIVDVKHVHYLLYTHTVTADNIFGLATSFMRPSFRAKSFTASYMILSWEDVNIMINMNLMDETPKLQESDKKEIRFGTIMDFLQHLIPCVILTNNTLALNGSMTNKVPIGLRDFQSVKFGMFKTKNVREMTIESPYFPRQIFKHSTKKSDGTLRKSKQHNFYGIVPYFSDVSYINQVNQHSIELAALNFPKENIVDTETLLAAFNDKNGHVPIIPKGDEAREQYPIINPFDIANNPFMCCVGRKQAFNVKTLHMERWMLFSQDNYVQTSILLQSHYVKIEKIAKNKQTLNFFNAALPTNPPLMEKHLSPAKPPATTTKKAKKTEEPDFL